MKKKQICVPSSLSNIWPSDAPATNTYLECWITNPRSSPSLPDEFSQKRKEEVISEVILMWATFIKTSLQRKRRKLESGKGKLFLEVCSKVWHWMWGQVNVTNKQDTESQDIQSLVRVMCIRKKCVMCLLILRALTFTQAACTMMPLCAYTYYIGTTIYICSLV